MTDQAPSFRTFLGYRDEHENEMHCAHAKCISPEMCLKGCECPVARVTGQAPELLESVTDELLAHGEFSSGANNRANAKIAAQVVIKMVQEARPPSEIPSEGGNDAHRNWQPIATALHKDGTRILAWDGKEQFTCFYRDKLHDDDKPGWFDQHVRMFPTHWKPLGPSPARRRAPVDRLSKVSK